jgi:hypothetical protein
MSSPQHGKEKATMKTMHKSPNWADLSPEAHEKRSKTRREAVEEVFAQPVAIEFSEWIGKIRLNLLMVSSLALALVILGIDVAPTNTLFGVSFENLSNDKLKWLLLAVNTYMWIHFGWLALDAFQGWRVRLTGSGVIYEEKPQHNDADYDLTLDPRQSSLHNWWLAMAARYPLDDQLTLKLTRLKDLLDEEHLSAPQLTMNSPISDHMLLRSKISNALQNIMAEQNFVRVILENPTPSAALARFDRAYEMLLKSQARRWLWVETLLPIVLGGVSIGTLLYSILFR